MPNVNAVLLLGFFVVITIGLAVAIEVPQDSDYLEVPISELDVAEELDLGLVESRFSNPRVVMLDLKNRSSKPLEKLAVSVDCGCVTVSPGGLFTIGPGGEAVLIVTLDPLKAAVGSRSLMLRFVSADGRTRSTRLIYRFEPAVRFEQVNLFLIADSPSTLSRSTVVGQVDPARIKADAIRLVSDSLADTRVSASLKVSGGSAEVYFKQEPGHVIGPTVEANFRLIDLTDSSVLHQFKVRSTVRVSIRAFPPVVLMKVDQRTGKFRGRFSIQGITADDVVVESLPMGFLATVLPGQDSSRPVLVL